MTARKALVAFAALAWPATALPGCRAPAVANAPAPQKPGPAPAPAAAATPSAPSAAPAPPPRAYPAPKAATQATLDCELAHVPILGWTYDIGLGNHPHAAHAFGDEEAGRGEQATRLCEALQASARKARATLTCYESKASRDEGVWAIRVTQPTAPEEYVRWRLVRAHPKRPALTGKAWKAGDGGHPYAGANDAATLPEALFVLDLDGDGADELVTSARRWLDAGTHHVMGVQIWTAKGGRIGAFEGTSQLSLTTVDGRRDDGRLEFAIDPYGFKFAVRSGYTRSKQLWSLLLELDDRGRPLLDTDRTRAYAKGLCPEPERLIDELRVLDDEECVAGYVHCANLWKLPTAAVDAALEDFCKRAYNPDYAGFCPESLPAWRGMLRVELPFRLGVAP